MAWAAHIDCYPLTPVTPHPGTVTGVTTHTSVTAVTGVTSTEHIQETSLVDDDALFGGVCDICGAPMNGDSLCWSCR
jgi:hypothetical protein